MGQKHSSAPGSIAPVSQQHENMPPAYQNSRRLLSDLVKDRYKRHLVANLRGDEAQTMADFMNRVLETASFPEHDDRKNILYTLSLLARSAQVFPERLKLTRVEYPDQTHWSSRGETYRGTFGQVQVCVKVISAEIAGNTHEQLLKVHAKEAILSAHMMHPNILPFYGVCDLSNGGSTRVGIVSEWMDQNLLEYLKKTVDLPQKYLLMSDIISGLAYMHGLDIIHADLQATNVLVSKERALLADFGASRVSIATRTGNSLGDIYRTSPELFLGEIGSATPESDIWAYACTCYEIITGAQPFAEFTGNIPSLMVAFKERRAVPTHSELKSGKIDKHVLKEMKRCWDYDPRKRPTASSLCEVFNGLRLEDRRVPRDGAVNSRVTSDTTDIKYDVVFGILQRVETTPSKKAPMRF